jgi:hypothetical protein
LARFANPQWTLHPIQQNTRPISALTLARSPLRPCQKRARGGREYILLKLALEEKNGD